MAVAILFLSILWVMRTIRSEKYSKMDQVNLMEGSLARLEENVVWRAHNGIIQKIDAKALFYYFLFI